MNLDYEIDDSSYGYGMNPRLLLFNSKIIGYNFCDKDIMKHVNSVNDIPDSCLVPAIS